jgi:hypothetical protein
VRREPSPDASDTARPEAGACTLRPERRRPVSNATVSNFPFDRENGRGYPDIQCVAVLDPELEDIGITRCNWTFAN